MLEFTLMGSTNSDIRLNNSTKLLKESTELYRNVFTGCIIGKGELIKLDNYNIKFNFTYPGELPNRSNYTLHIWNLVHGLCDSKPKYVNDNYIISTHSSSLFSQMYDMFYVYDTSKKKDVKSLKNSANVKQLVETSQQLMFFFMDCFMSRNSTFLRNNFVNSKNFIILDTMHYSAIENKLISEALEKLHGLSSTVENVDSGKYALIISNVNGEFFKRIHKHVPKNYHKLLYCENVQGYYVEHESLVPDNF